jgi:hypothetical protein
MPARIISTLEWPDSLLFYQNLYSDLQISNHLEFYNILRRFVRDAYLYFEINIRGALEHYS